MRPQPGVMLPNRLLSAFEDACSSGRLELAGALLQDCEAAMHLDTLPDRERRSCEEVLISAFEQLWFLRHAAQPAA